MKKIIPLTIIFACLFLVACVKQAPADESDQCPDLLFQNKMPMACDTVEECDALIREYYIVDGKRKELTDFDSEWVEQNCDVKVEAVY